MEQATDIILGKNVNLQDSIWTMSANIGPDMIWFDNAPQIFWGILKAMPDLYSVQVFAFFENNTCSMNSMWFDSML